MQFLYKLSLIKTPSTNTADKSLAPPAAKWKSYKAPKVKLPAGIHSLFKKNVEINYLDELFWRVMPLGLSLSGA